jgi:PKD repeat protein
MARALTGAVVFVLSTLAGASPGWAALPANDDFANAAPILSLPFTDSGDLSGTSLEPNEPQYCYGSSQSAWYVFTPSSTVAVTVDLNGSDGGVSTSVFQSFGPDFGSLGFVGCAAVGSTIEFTAEASRTYYIQIGNSGGLHLQLNVQSVPPPLNDAFGSATAITSRPFTDFVDLTAATIEPGEPVTPAGAFTPIVASAWYTYTPLVNETLSITADSCCVTPVFTVYKGSSVGSLTEVASHSGFGFATFAAQAGTAYHFQVGRGVISGGMAQTSFQLIQTPPPVANFAYFPSPPSSLDTVQFNDYSYDPVQAGFASEAWQLGDGTSFSGCCPSHRYPVDGDYTVALTVTTVDGRTASTTQTVPVRTHDIAIVKFTVPSTARSGQTKELTVGVRNALYPESVQFQLLKSTPVTGFQNVGMVTQLVPVRSSNKTVPVTFSYTFSPEDAAVGKVTFMVVATLVGGNDVFPADNTAISSPVRVSR